MALWLAEEEQSFGTGLTMKVAARSPRSQRDYSILLRGLRVINNGKLFGTSSLIAFAVAVDGFPDIRSGMPFWTQQLSFAGVRDGADLSIDPTTGALVYRGRPKDFVNLHILMFRDTSATREFAKVLKDSFVAEGIGLAAGAAISIFSSLPPGITIPATRELAKRAVNTTLDYYAKRKEKLIGTFYASLIRETDYGLGLHPAKFPTDLISCGEAMELGYEVRR